MSQKTKALCNGCRDDFYNDHNPYGVKTCWHFEKAVIVTKMRVGTWQNPPYKWSPQECLSCYSPEGASMIERDDPRVTVPSPVTVSQGLAGG